MWCTQNFAIIANERVENVMVCDDYDVANQLARSMCGENAIAIDVSHIAVEVGDTYRNGQFFRGEEAIEPERSIEDRLNELNGYAHVLEDAACELDEVVYQRLLELEDAVCELSEMIGGQTNG